MALCRCTKHPPRARTRTYTHIVEPLGYPNTSSICGNEKCSSSGLIWLDTDDYISFQAGERVFPYPNAASKVKVTNNIKPK